MDILRLFSSARGNEAQLSEAFAQLQQWVSLTWKASPSEVLRWLPAFRQLLSSGHLRDALSRGRLPEAAPDFAISDILHNAWVHLLLCSYTQSPIDFANELCSWLLALTAPPCSVPLSSSISFLSQCMSCCSVPDLRTPAGQVIRAWISACLTIVGTEVKCAILVCFDT